MSENPIFFGPSSESTVYARVARIIEEMPALGKDRKNPQQGFFYRGIDDILAALKPLLGRHQVVIVPDVVDRQTEQRPTAKGGVLYTVHLKVRFTFYGPDGSHFVASGWGEGTDAGDKATNKAMTGAFKYVLGQVFAVADADHADADAESPPEAPRRGVSPAQKDRARKAAQTRQEPTERKLVTLTRERLLERHEGDVAAAGAFLEWRFNGYPGFDGKLGSLPDEALVELMAELNPEEARDEQRRS